MSGSCQGYHRVEHAILALLSSQLFQFSSQLAYGDFQQRQTTKFYLPVQLGDGSRLTGAASFSNLIQDDRSGLEEDASFIITFEAWNRTPTLYLSRPVLFSRRLRTELLLSSITSASMSFLINSFKFWQRGQEDPVRCILLGADASGKTTLLYKWKLGQVITTIPTIGFNVEVVERDGQGVCFWDAGGSLPASLVRLWYHLTAARLR